MADQRDICLHGHLRLLMAALLQSLLRYMTGVESTLLIVNQEVIALLRTFIQQRANGRAICQPDDR